jgi:hypothetical protein
MVLAEYIENEMSTKKFYSSLANVAVNLSKGHNGEKLQEMRIDQRHRKQALIVVSHVIVVGEMGKRRIFVLKEAQGWKEFGCADGQATGGTSS